MHDNYSFYRKDFYVTHLLQLPSCCYLTTMVSELISIAFEYFTVWVMECHSVDSPSDVVLPLHSSPRNFIKLSLARDYNVILWRTLTKLGLGRIERPLSPLLANHKIDAFPLASNWNWLSVGEREEAWRACRNDYLLRVTTASLWPSTWGLGWTDYTIFVISEAWVITGREHVDS